MTIADWHLLDWVSAKFPESAKQINCLIRTELNFFLLNNLT